MLYGTREVLVLKGITIQHSFFQCFCVAYNILDPIKSPLKVATKYTKLISKSEFDIYWRRSESHKKHSFQSKHPSPLSLHCHLIWTEASLFKKVCKTKSLTKVLRDEIFRHNFKKGAIIFSWKRLNSEHFSHFSFLMPEPDWLFLIEV